MGGVECIRMAKVSFQDFLVEGLVQEGAWGTVYAGKRIADEAALALVPLSLSLLISLRNFSATRRTGRAQWISPTRSAACFSSSEWRDLFSWLEYSKTLQRDYVSFYHSLSHTHSFYSTVPGKNPHWCQSYPVIVMEFLSGGDLLTRLSSKKDLSEKNIAMLFKSVVVALSSIHKKGFIHR